MPTHESPTSRGRGFAIRELIISIFCTALLLSAVLPGLARGRALSLSALSLGNPISRGMRGVKRGTGKN